MCARPTRHTITAPSIQMTAIGATALPHWMLSTVTVAGASSTIALTPKFVGFQMCRPFSRSTYFERIEMKLVKKYGHMNGDRMRMPALIPLM